MSFLKFYRAVHVPLFNVCLQEADQPLSCHNRPQEDKYLDHFEQEALLIREGPEPHRLHPVPRHIRQDSDDKLLDIC